MKDATIPGDAKITQDTPKEQSSVLRTRKAWKTNHELAKIDLSHKMDTLSNDGGMKVESNVGDKVESDTKQGGISFPSTTDGSIKEDIQASREASQPQSRSTNGNSPNDSLLDCTKHGGPSNAEEMIYWRRESNPFPVQLHPHKFVTFEMDEGGFNNIRMSLETATALALATGRTLVLPPSQKMYLLETQSQGVHDFFPMVDMLPLPVMTTQEFLEQRRSANRTIPFNRTDWEGSSAEEVSRLSSWMRETFVTPDWRPQECVVVVPSNGTTTSTVREPKNERVSLDHLYGKYRGKPISVTGSAQTRLEAALGYRVRTCEYNLELQQEEVLHFRGGENERLLIHFYAYVFSEDWRADLYIKRYIRNHFRYVDSLQCAAARVVQHLRDKAFLHSNGATNLFSTIHVRRGDFRVKKARATAHHILEKLNKTIPLNATLYVATDERNKSFFEGFYQHYHVYFLNDFKQELEGIHSNYFGMIDQLISARGDSFLGCFWSTFSGYINRLRGYHSQTSKEPGWKEGVLRSWYYVPDRFYSAMRKYDPIVKPIPAREFPLGWMDIDHDLNHR